MNPVISVVIGTFNQESTLKLVLESFNRQTASRDAFEVVVVDSSSIDGTGEMIRMLMKNFNLQYLRQENRGRPAARNRGVKEARGEIILFTDADMIADQRLVEEHLKAQQRFGEVALEGLTYNVKSLDDYKAPDNLTPYIRERIKPFQKIRWSYFLTGNLSIRKQNFIDAGMFDEDFTGYGWEDIELGYRLYKRKIPLHYLPSAVNYHYHLVSSDEMLKRKYNMGRSAAIFAVKHPEWPVKYFLGMNPLAMGIYRFIKARKNILKLIEEKAKASPVFRYILEEYYYRKGMESVHKTP